MSKYFKEQLEKSIRKHTEDGGEVVYGDATTICVDIDDTQDTAVMDEVLPIVRQALGVTEIARWTSRGGEGVHVLLKTEKELPFLERLLLQACLGSDPKREILGYLRQKSDGSEISCLFRPGEV